MATCGDRGPGLRMTRAVASTRATDLRISGEPTGERHPTCYIQAADLGRCRPCCEGDLPRISRVVAQQNQLQGRYTENVPVLGIRLAIRTQRFSKPSSSAVPFIRPTLPNGRVEMLSVFLNETHF